MNTALKSVNDARPSRTRVAVLWIVVLAAVGGMAALFLSALSDVGQPVMARQDDASMPRPHESAAQTCLRLSENPTDYLSGEAMARRTELRLASCKQAFAAEPDNTQLKVAVARAMPIEQRAQSVALLREAAAQNDAEAWYEIYESHKSWDRGDLRKVPVVPRAEADRALHRAAGDLGQAGRRGAWHRPAGEAGRPIRRQDRACECNPQRRPGTRASAAGRGAASRSRRRNPGACEDADSGEGGPADPERAPKMLTARKDMASASGVLGQPTLEGRLVPRDLQEARRTRRDGGADRPEIVGEPPVSGPAGSL
jgi:hypothetical protein